MLRKAKKSVKGNYTVPPDKFILYKTTNKINGKFYYGVHNGSKPCYLGSGNLIKLAISKYGKENFERKTIAECRNGEEAYKLEGLVVDKDMVDNPMCYNLRIGGGGYSTPTLTEYVCPHCNKKGKGGFMVVYHGENCKLATYAFVPTDIQDLSAMYLFVTNEEGFEEYKHWNDLLPTDYWGEDQT